MIHIENHEYWLCDLESRVALLENAMPGTAHYREVQTPEKPQPILQHDVNKLVKRLDQLEAQIVYMRKKLLEKNKVKANSAF